MFNSVQESLPEKLMKTLFSWEVSKLIIKDLLKSFKKVVKFSHNLGSMVL